MWTCWLISDDDDDVEDEKVSHLFSETKLTFSFSKSSSLMGDDKGGKLSLQIKHFKEVTSIFTD